MYGSFLIYEADKAAQQYKFITYVNTTSQDAAGLFPQFMYESILRDALSNDELSFKTRISPLPRAKIAGFSEDSYSALGVIYTTAVVYALVLSNIVSYLVIERTSGFKLLQVISGMQLSSYWCANFVMDFLKMQPLIWSTIFVFQAWSLDYEAAWLTYLLFPLAVLPFTYVTSLLFATDNSAQSYTMFFNFLIISTISVFVYAFRGTPQLEQTGDNLNLVFKIVPTYGVASSVFIDALGGTLSKLREWSGEDGTGEALDPEVWALTNVTMDVIVSLGHFVLWSCVLCCMEKYQMRPVAKSSHDPRGRETRQESKIEVDVLEEERRVESGARDVL